MSVMGSLEITGMLCPNVLDYVQKNSTVLGCSPIEFYSDGKQLYRFA